MNIQDFKQFVVENPDLVQMRLTHLNDVYLLKYTRKVFYDALWNEYLEYCRGTLIDSNFNLISKPLKKIYNYGIEKDAPTFNLDKKVVAYKKINGFFAAMTWHNNSILISTTGSTTSEFTQYIKDMMLYHNTWNEWERILKVNQGYTLTFECVHPNDPHIIKEEIGLHLIGANRKRWEEEGYPLFMSGWSDYATNILKCHSIEEIRLPLKDLVEKAKTEQHEGYVFHQDNKSAKIKTPYYLNKKFLARCKSSDKILNKQNIEEEYYPLYDHVRNNINEFVQLDEQQRLEYIRNFLNDTYE